MGVSIRHIRGLCGEKTGGLRTDLKDCTPLNRLKISETCSVSEVTQTHDLPAIAEPLGSHTVHPALTDVVRAN